MPIVRFTTVQPWHQLAKRDENVAREQRPDRAVGLYSRKECLEPRLGEARDGEVFAVRLGARNAPKRHGGEKCRAMGEARKAGALSAAGEAR
jgi:hypothetical protein